MSTKRKTLKQKQKSDERQSQRSQMQDTSSNSPLFSLPLNVSPTRDHSLKVSNQISTYDLSETRRSIFVSIGLVVSNGIVYIIYENGLIPLNYIGF